MPFPMSDALAWALTSVGQADMYCRVCGWRDATTPPLRWHRWQTVWGERVCLPCCRWWRDLHLRRSDPPRPNPGASQEASGEGP